MKAFEYLGSDAQTQENYRCNRYPGSTPSTTSLVVRVAENLRAKPELEAHARAKVRGATTRSTSLPPTAPRRAIRHPTNSDTSASPAPAAKRRCRGKQHPVDIHDNSDTSPCPAPAAKRRRGGKQDPVVIDGSPNERHTTPDTIADFFIGCAGVDINNPNAYGIRRLVMLGFSVECAIAAVNQLDAEATATEGAYHGPIVAQHTSDAAPGSTTLFGSEAADGSPHVEVASPTAPTCQLPPDVSVLQLVSVAETDAPDTLSDELFKDESMEASSTGLLDTTLEAALESVMTDPTTNTIASDVLSTTVDSISIPSEDEYCDDQSIHELPADLSEPDQPCVDDFDLRVQPTMENIATPEPQPQPAQSATTDAASTSQLDHTSSMEEDGYESIPGIDVTTLSDVNTPEPASSPASLQPTDPCIDKAPGAQPRSRSVSSNVLTIDEIEAALGPKFHGMFPRSARLTDSLKDNLVGMLFRYHFSKICRADKHRLLKYIKKLRREYREQRPAPGAPLFEGVPVATGCSGSDSIIDTVEIIDMIIRELLPDTEPDAHISTFEHAFATELNPDVRAYLQKAFPGLKKCFSDIGSLKNHKCVNSIDPSLRFAIVGTAWLFAAGFVCKDISSLNPHGAMFDSCCSNTTTSRTGSTFRGALGYAQTWQPRHIILENVRAVQKQLDAILKALSQAGYNVVVFDNLGPTMFGIPCQRDRVYIFGSRTLTPAMLQELGRIVDSFKMLYLFPTRSFLFDNDDRVVVSELTHLLDSKWTTGSSTKASAKAPKSEKWHDYHEDVDKLAKTKSGASASARTATPWHCTAKTAQNPWYDLLSSREISVARGTFSGLADLSQAHGRVPVGADDMTSPCVTPGGRLYSFEADRLLVGLDKCMLQGIVPRPAIAYDPSFSHTFWHDLAGNGFCAYVVTIIIIALLIVESHAYFPEDEPSAPAATPNAEHTPADAVADDLDLMAAAMLHMQEEDDLDELNQLLASSVMDAP